MPIGHLGLNVADLAVARAYYDRLMTAVEFEPFLSEADQIAYRPAGGKPGTYVFIYPALEGGPVTLSVTQIDQFGSGSMVELFGILTV